MIYLFEFSGTLLEFANSGGKPVKVFHSIYDLFSEDCIIIYRYELNGRIPSEVNKKGFISSKFGTSKSRKIDFSKLKGGNIILMHLDVYKDNPDEIRKLLDFCQSEGKNLYLPVSDGDSQFFFKKSDFSENPHRYRISEIISDEYEHVKYDFRRIFSASEFNSRLVEMRRDLAVRALLG